jgi:hypothetical protein
MKYTELVEAVLKLKQLDEFNIMNKTEDIADEVIEKVAAGLGVDLSQVSNDDVADVKTAILDIIVNKLRNL